ncbi:MAG TPA: DNA translocase FtsK [Anaerolineae bacterium]|nr:DNA translocase FtsK [Anaerolineae bacterium]
MQKHELESQADRIEMVLRDHRAPARVTGGNVTPRWIQFLVQTAPGIKVNRVEALSREIAMALGASNARVSMHAGAVRIEIPRSDPQPVKLLPLLARLPPIPAGAALLGLADDGAPLLLRLPSTDVAHVLVAGTTGSGKTALVQSMIVSLAMSERRSQMQFVLIDPKGRAFEGLSTLPHLLKPIVSQTDRAVQTLNELVSLMETRDQTRVTDPRIVIVLDELADLVQTGGSEVIDRLGRLVQRGRQAGIHVIGATQKPSSAILGPLVKANFPVRLVGRVVSSDDARVAAGIGGTGAERLTGHSDFVAVSGMGVTRFQAAFISPGEMLEVAAKLSNGKHRSEIGRSDVKPAWGNDREESDVFRSALRVLRRVK